MFNLVEKHKRLVQIVLALITLPFAFFGIDYYFRRADTAPEVASAGDVKVTQVEFDEALREQGERLRGQLQQQYDPSILDRPEVRYAVLEQLLNQKLLQAKARRDGLRVNDAQLQDFIATVPAFQENGTFSPERYRQLLGAQNMTPVQFEERLRAQLVMAPLTDPTSFGNFVARASGERFITLLEQQREVAIATLAAQAFAKDVKVDDAAVKAQFDQNPQAFKTPEQASFEYVVLTPEAVQSQVTVDEAAARQAYQANQKQYGQEEERSASHILIAVKPDAKPEEKEAARKKAEDIAAQAKANPGKFAELAKQYSQDPGSAPQGGDLGSFGHGTMVKAFDDAVFAMKPGEITGPVASEFGYHVIKLNGITPSSVKPFEQVRKQIEDELRRQKASAKFAAAADQFQNLVYEQADSLQGVAKALNLKVQSSPMVSRAQALVIAQGNAKFIDALFSPESTQNKRNTEAIEVAPGTLMAGRIVEYKPSTPLPFDQVKDQIRQQLVQTAEAEAAQKAGTEKLALLTQGKKEQEVGLSFGAPVKVLRNQPPPDMSPAMLTRVFQADPGKLPQYMGGPTEHGDYAIYKLVQVIPPAAIDEQKIKAATGRIGEQLGRELLTAYIASLKGKNEVKINQANLEKR